MHGAGAEVVVTSQPERAEVLLIESWLHGRTAHTLRAYQADLRRFRSVCTKPLGAVTLSDLQAFADSLGGLSAASRYRTLSGIKSLFAFGFRVGYLRFDPGRVLRLPPVRNRLSERILPEEQVRCLIAREPAERNRVILKLLYASGMRVSEVCALQIRDLLASGDCGRVTVFGKGGVTRVIHLQPEIWEPLSALTRERPPDDAVFCSRKTGFGLRPGAVRTIVKHASERAGISQPVSPHWLRHAHASHALDHGAPIHLVQATLGHASLATTGRYAHARPKESSGRYLQL